MDDCDARCLLLFPITTNMAGTASRPRGIYTPRLAFQSEPKRTPILISFLSEGPDNCSLVLLHLLEPGHRNRRLSQLG
jgi:hypothetical protein